MSMPWTNPPAASWEFGLADHVGTLAFFVIGGVHSGVWTSFGEKDAIRCALVMLDGPEAGKEFEDIMIFNSRVVSRLRSAPGQVILARIAVVQGKGTQQPIELLDPTPADNQLAQSWHSYYPTRLNEMSLRAQASWQAEERKAQVSGAGRVQSAPHPTHAGQQQNYGQQPNTYNPAARQPNIHQQMAAAAPAPWTQPGAQPQQLDQPAPPPPPPPLPAPPTWAPPQQTPNEQPPF